MNTNRYALVITMFALSLTLEQSLHAGVMAAGDLAFTAFNADSDDAFQVVALTEIDPNTIVYFSERNWLGTEFNSVGNEGTLRWDSGSSTITSGSLIDFTSLQSSTFASSVGTASKSGLFNLNAVNEQLFAYLDASNDATPDAFIAAISNRGFFPVTNAASTLAGTGLTAGTTAVNFTGLEDIMEYVGPRTGQSDFASYLSLIGDTGNWISQGVPGDQSTDGIGPDVPFNATTFSTSTTSPVVPEPTSIAIWTVGLLGLVRRSRKSITS